MAKKNSRIEIVAAERAAWDEVVKRLDFLINASATHTDKVLIDDAAAKVAEAISNFNPLHGQRARIEFEAVA